MTAELADIIATAHQTPVQDKIERLMSLGRRILRNAQAQRALEQHREAA